MLQHRHSSKLDTAKDNNPAVVVTNISKVYQIRDEKNHYDIKSLVSLLTQTNQIPFESLGDRHFSALKDVSFQLKVGESLGVIGENGAGKSTLLQILSGTLQPSSGEVFTSGRICSLLELGSGFNPLFTGKENIYLNAAIYGLTQNEIDERYSDIVSFADIGEYIEQPVNTYSSGMQLRLAFSVVAHISPEVLIIDEAFAVGDVIFMQKCMRFIREFQSSGSLILVSHDIGAVQSLCDSCLWLCNGEIRGYGDPKQVCDLYVAYANGQISELDENHKINLDEENAVACSSSFTFKDNYKGLGKKGAIFEEVSLRDSETRKTIANIRGGEKVTLSISIKINAKIRHPVVGFIFRNRLGQDLFSENTYGKYKESPINLKEEDRINVRFSFRMPILASGDYSITVAIAEAISGEFDVHHWIYDALIISSISTSWSTGLVGIPMEEIKMQVAK